MNYPTNALNPSRVVDELKELRHLTGDAHGAQRLAWTPTWETARTWLHDKMRQIPVEVEVDAAGNSWGTLRGRSTRALVIGSHIDSVADGGWLDGSLGVVAGLEVMRRLAAEGIPPLTVRLVSWADEEGARFGCSLLGSGLAAGSLDPQAVSDFTDKNGVALREALAAHGVDLDRAAQARQQLEEAAAYLELHIEQGPVLEGLGLPLGAVQGTFGLERHAIRFTGQAAHAGSTPMAVRRDALAAAAKLALEIRSIANHHGGVCTMGSVITRPGIITAVVGQGDCLLDQRCLDGAHLEAMLEEAQAASQRFAREENVSVEWKKLYHVEPVGFHRELFALAGEAIRETCASAPQLPSGALHDATGMARLGIPTGMLFVQSLRGLSHTPEEDTREEHLLLAVEALDRLVDKTLDWLTRG